MTRQRAVRNKDDALRAACYLRLSKPGEAPIERQRQDCQHLIDQRGWVPAGEYVDNLSAFREDVIRPEYLRLLDQVEAGLVDVVVVYNRDRLWRQIADQVNFLKIARRSQLQVIASATEPDFDPTSSVDKFTAVLLTAHAEMSSEDTARRVRRAQLSMANAGKVSGGGHRAFGYERDGMTIRQSEADLIVGAVATVLDGGSLGTVVKLWNETGVRTTTGRLWNRTVLRNLLIRGRIAGIREHLGHEVGPAAWPAIVPEEDWRRAAALLTSRNAAGRGNVAVTLLSGIARCGKCGARLGSEPPRHRPDGRPLPRLYACRPRVDGGCRSVTIRMPLLDEVVERDLFAAIESGRFADSVSSRENASMTGDLRAVSAQLDADRSKLKDLQDGFFMRDSMPRTQFLQIEEEMLARIRTQERRLEAANGMPGLDIRTDLSSVDRMRARWAAETLAWKRQVVAAVFERIEVLPSTTSGGRVFDDSRVVTVAR